MAEFIWETPTEITLDLAKKLQKIRKRRKITQKQLAEIRKDKDNAKDESLIEKVKGFFS